MGPLGADLRVRHQVLGFRRVRVCLSFFLFAPRVSLSIYLCICHESARGTRARSPAGITVQSREKAGRGLCPVLVATTPGRFRGRVKRALRGRRHRELTSQHAWRASTLTTTTGRLVEAVATVRQGRRRWHQMLTIRRKAPARSLFVAHLRCQTTTTRSTMRSFRTSSNRTRRRASRHPEPGAAGQRRLELMHIAAGRGVAATQALVEEHRRDRKQH